MTTVKQNRNTLRILRTSFENAEKMTAQATKLENVHLFLQRLQIIGVIIEFQVICHFCENSSSHLFFQNLVQRALESVLEHRIPYLLAPIREIHSAIQSNGAGDLGNNKQLELEVQLKVFSLINKS